MEGLRGGDKQPLLDHLSPRGLVGLFVFLYLICDMYYVEFAIQDALVIIDCLLYMIRHSLLSCSIIFVCVCVLVVPCESVCTYL